MEVISCEREICKSSLFFSNISVTFKYSYGIRNFSDSIFYRSIFLPIQRQVVPDFSTISEQLFFITTKNALPDIYNGTFLEKWLTDWTVDRVLYTHLSIKSIQETLFVTLLVNSTRIKGVKIEFLNTLFSLLEFIRLHNMNERNAWLFISFSMIHIIRNPYWISISENLLDNKE